MKTILLLMLLISCALGASWFDLFFRKPSYNNQREAYYGNQGEQHRRGKNGKERWKEICRTINADSYAFPGRVPYPAAPVCPW